MRPNTTGIPPSYEQKTVPEDQKRGRLRLLASPDGAEDSVVIHADAKMYAGLFNSGDKAALALNPARKAYVHLIKGSLEINGQQLQGGDAAMIEGESAIQVSQGADAEVIVFDLAA